MKEKVAADEGCTYCHGEQPWLVMLQSKALVGKLFCPVYGSGARAITIDEISALEHEVLDLY